MLVALWTGSCCCCCSSWSGADFCSRLISCKEIRGAGQQTTQHFFFFISSPPSSAVAASLRRCRAASRRWRMTGGNEGRRSSSSSFLVTFKFPSGDILLPKRWVPTQELLFLREDVVIDPSGLEPLRT